MLFLHNRPHLLAIIFCDFVRLQNQPSYPDTLDILIITQSSSNMPFVCVPVYCSEDSLYVRLYPNGAISFA